MEFQQLGYWKQQHNYWYITKDKALLICTPEDKNYNGGCIILFDKGDKPVFEENLVEISKEEFEQVKNAYLKRLEFAGSKIGMNSKNLDWNTIQSEDWKLLRDTFKDALGKDFSKEELKELLYYLPQDLQKEGKRWGVSDYIFRIDVLEYAKENFKILESYEPSSAGV